MLTRSLSNMAMDQADQCWHDLVTPGEAPRKQPPAGHRARVVRGGLGPVASFHAGSSFCRRPGSPQYARFVDSPDFDKTAQRYES